jgi:hypothetical protein
MDVARLNEVINLSTVVQILHNGELVRVESVNESDNGSTAQVVYAENGRRATVPVEQLSETCLPESPQNYIYDSLTRWSPIIRG